MPSGSKKRKAAKKKKSQHHTHNNNNYSTHENDEHKSQDDTDGGEVSSPASHVQVHPFDDGNSGSDPSPDRSPLAENESTFAKEEFALKEELKDDAKIEEENKSEGDNWEVEEVGIELVDSAKEVNVNEGTPNISSLVNEEKSIEKEIDCESETTSYETKPTEVTTKDTESEAFTQIDDNLIVEPVLVIDELNSVAEPVSEEVVEVLESASVENSPVFYVTGSALNGNTEKLTDDDIEILQAGTINVENNENKVSLSSNENNVVPVFEVVESASVENPAVFDATGSVLKGNAEKLSDDDIEILQAATTSVEASENDENKVSLSSIENNVVPVFESASVENSAVFDAAGSVLKGNAEKLSDDDIEILQAATTIVEASENDENKVSLSSIENNVVPVFESASVENSAVLDAAGSVLKGNAEKLSDDDIEILQAATTIVEASENDGNKVSLSSIENNVVPVFESASVENSAVFDAAGSVLKGNAEKLSDDDIEILQAATTIVEASENDGNKVSLSSIENNVVPVFESASVENSAIFDAAGSVLKGNAEKLSDDDIEILQAATTSVEASENNENKVSLSSIENKVVPVFESASVENSGVFNAAGSVLKGNPEKLSDDYIEILQAATTSVESIDNNEKNVSLLSKEIVGASLEKEGLKLPDALSDIMDVAATEIKVKTFPVLEENIIGASSNSGESAISGIESRDLMSSEAPSAVTSRGFKDSETEPLVAPAPPVVRKTSWLNCCGIFYVLSGSSR